MKNKTAMAIYESTAYSMIQSAKINLDNQGMQIISGKMDDQSVAHVLPAQIENYLNALDYACSLYFSHDINKQRFVMLYGDDIRNIFENSVYKEHANLSSFINLGMYYKMVTAVDKAKAKS